MKKAIFIAALLLFLNCSKQDDLDLSFAPCSLIDYDRYTNEEASVLLSNLPFERRVDDLWGYIDENTGLEYVLVGFGHRGPMGDTTGIYIVELSDATAPKLVSTLNEVDGWDIKTWKNYMYSVNGNAPKDGSIVDLNDPARPKVVGSFPGAHNIFLSCQGLLILSDPGLRIYNLTADPVAPKLLWSDETDGGHEAAVVSDILYDFHGFNGTFIYDISDPTDPELLSIITSELIHFHHSGWPNEDESILIINDERPAGSAELGEDFTIWDISDKKAPKLLSKSRDLESTIHNVHIIKDKAYFSYYVSGYRIFDISDPTAPVMTFEFDTAPAQTGKGNFRGAFGIYALSPSGNVFVSDRLNGLFIFGKH